MQSKFRAGPRADWRFFGMVLLVAMSGPPAITAVATSRPAVSQGAPSGSSAVAPDGFAVGAKVEAQTGGQWRPALILKRDKDRYFVKFASPTKSACVSATQIRKIGQPSPGPGADPFNFPKMPGSQEDDQALRAFHELARAKRITFTGTEAWQYRPEPVVALGNFTRAPIKLAGGHGDFFDRGNSLYLCPISPPKAVISHVVSFPANSRSVTLERVDLTSGRSLGVAEVESTMRALAVSPDASKALLRSGETGLEHHGRLDLWAIDAAPAKRLSGWVPYAAEANGPNPFDSIWAAFVDNNHVLTWNRDEPVVLWELPQARPLFQIATSIRPVLSPDRKAVIVRQEQRYGVINTMTGQVLGALPVNVPEDASFVFRPDGKQLASFKPGRLTIWMIAADGVKGGEEIVVPSRASMERLDWVGEIGVYEHLLSDGQFLLDIKTGLPIWRYSFDDLRASFGTMGGRLWYAMESAGQKDGAVLVSTIIPDGAVKKMAESLDPAKTMLVRPGTEVTLEIKMPHASDAARNAVRQVLKTKLEANGCKVADGKPIKLVATETKGATGEVKYPRMGLDPVVLKYTNMNWSIGFFVADKPVWSVQTSSGPPPRLKLQRGADPERALAEQMPRAETFFGGVLLPRNVPVPRIECGFGAWELGPNGPHAPIKPAPRPSTGPASRPLR